MITTNNSQKNIIESHSSIKIYFMPSRGRRGPRIMSREDRMLGRELPSLFMEEESFVNFLGKMWKGGWGGRGGGIGVDGDGEDWSLLSILFLWNHTWSHMTDASRVKEWASCNWRFKYFLGLRIKLTQSEMDERGRQFGCIGHGEVSHIDSVMGH